MKANVSVTPIWRPGPSIVSFGKLRAIFNDAGSHGPWNDRFCFGNPASDTPVQSYSQFISKEQTAAHFSPKQASPLFFDKLSTLTRYLVTKAFSSAGLTPIQRYIFARDAAFFCTDFFSGDRGSDHGRTLTKEVLLLPDGQGLLFRQTIEKTLRGRDFLTFALKKSHDTFLCPVANLLRYFDLCKCMQIDLRDGYFFRSTDKHNCVSNNPFIGSSIAARLKTHVDHLGIADGETMHSFRSGCLITLSMLAGVLPSLLFITRKRIKFLASPIQPIFLLEAPSLWPPQTYLKPRVSQTSSALIMT